MTEKNKGKQPGMKYVNGSLIFQIHCQIWLVCTFHLNAGKSTLVQAMARCPTGTEPLPEPLLTKMSAAIRHF